MENLEYSDMTNDGAYDEWELNYCAGQMNGDYGLDLDFMKT